MAQAAETKLGVKKLEFYFLELGCPGYKRYDYTKSPKWKEHVEAEENRTLQEMYPRHDRPIAALFVDSKWKQEALVCETDEDGNWGTTDELLAAKILASVKEVNPHARLHPWSPKIRPEIWKKALEEERSRASVRVGPRQ